MTHSQRERSRGPHRVGLLRFLDVRATMRLYLFSLLCSSLVTATATATTTTTAKRTTLASVDPDGIITYESYEKDIADRQQQQSATATQAFLDALEEQQQSCEGFPQAFAEEAFITLYGPRVEQEFEPRDGKIFLRILREVLNKCANPCNWVDTVEIDEEELQKISILNLDFSGFPDGTDRNLLEDEEEEEDGADLTQEERQLQKKKRTKKRRIKKAVMRGRRSKKKKKNGRELQLEEDDDEDNLPILPRDNTCGEMLMDRLAETGNPAFECVFPRGAFVTSCDPRNIPLLAIDEEPETQGQSSPLKSVQVATAADRNDDEDNTSSGYYNDQNQVDNEKHHGKHIRYLEDEKDTELFSSLIDSAS